MTTPPMALAFLAEREMNKTEAAYALHLRQMLNAKLIRWWDYQSMKFRLADLTWYTPDFIVVAQDGVLEAHEVKAFWVNRGKPGFREDARVKLKVAAERHPLRFLAVWKQNDGIWRTENINGDPE